MAQAQTLGLGQPQEQAHQRWGMLQQEVQQASLWQAVEQQQGRLAQGHFNDKNTSNTTKGV